LPFENVNLPLEITKKNRLVFPSRCEKSTCFFLPLEDQTSSEKTPYLHCRKKLLFAIMYFFTTSRTENENIAAEDTLFGKNRFLFRRRNQNFGKIPLRR